METLDEIYDLIGFRIITLFKCDIDMIRNILEQELNVLWADDKTKAKAEDAFGYLSVHYEISLSEK